MAKQEQRTGDFDTWTVAGRQAFDASVREELDLTSSMSLSDVAARCGFCGFTDEDQKFKRAVSASLKRGERDGWTVVEGKGSWRRYKRKVAT